MKKIVLLFLLSAGMTVPLFSGGSTESASQEKRDEPKTRLVEDTLGRKVEVPIEPKRVVGIGAGGLRLIVFAGGTDLLVGIEDFEKKDQKKPYVMAHEELLELPSIGPKHGADPELVAGVRPDLIIGAHLSREKADSMQTKTGCPVVTLNHGVLIKENTSYEPLFEAIKMTGELLNREESAQRSITYIKSLLEDLDKRTRNISKEKQKEVYIGGMRFHGAHEKGLLSTDPVYRPFTFIHAKNVASKVGSNYVTINEEQLLQWDPEYIFVDAGGKKNVDIDAPEFSLLTALKEGKVYLLPPLNYYNTNFSTEIANSYFIGKMIYPDQFKDITPEEKADEIYRTLLGKAVYQEMKKVWGGYKALLP